LSSVLPYGAGRPPMPRRPRRHVTDRALILHSRQPCHIGNPPNSAPCRLLSGPSPNRRKPMEPSIATSRTGPVSAYLNSPPNTTVFYLLRSDPLVFPFKEDLLRFAFQDRRQRFRHTRQHPRHRTPSEPTTHPATLQTPHREYRHHPGRSLRQLRLIITEKAVNCYRDFLARFRTPPSITDLSRR
jgi:hypothetical protein